VAYDLGGQLDLHLAIYVQRDVDSIPERAIRAPAEHAAANGEILETIQTVDTLTMLKQSLARDWDSKEPTPFPKHGTHERLLVFFPCLLLSPSTRGHRLLR
jgi:hypothetical protein